MPNLGTLTLDLVAKTGGFTKPLDKAERHSKKTAKQIAREQKKLRAQMKQTIKRAGAWGAAFVAAAAVGAAAFVKGAIDAADKAAKTARAVGVATEAFQALTFAASLGGVEQDKLKDGLKDLSIRLGEAALGAKAQIAVFDTLGISVRNAKGEMKSADEVLLETADIFADMPDGVEKTALAIKVFGESGLSLIPLLNGGTKSIKDMMEQAQELGLVMSHESAVAAEAFNDSLTVLEASAGGLWNQVTANLLPALNTLTGELIGVTEDSGAAKVAADGISDAFKGLASVVVGVVAAFNLAGQAIGSLAALAAFAIERDWDGARDVIQNMGGDLEETYTKYADVIRKLWEDTDDPALNAKIQERAGLLEKLKTALAPPGAAAGGSSASRVTGKSFIAGFLAPIDNDLKAAEKERRERIAASIAGLKEEFTALSRSEAEQKKYNALKAAGVEADSEAGQQILKLVEAIEKREAATKAATEAMEDQLVVSEEAFTMTKTLEEAENEQRQKYARMTDAFTDTFVAGFTGQMDTVKDIWRNALENMYIEYVNNLARMAAEQVLFGSDGTSGLVGAVTSIFSGGGGGGGNFAPLGFAAEGAVFPSKLHQVSGALANGGVGTRKSNWQLFEKGPEAVIPLSNPNAVKPIVKALGGENNSEIHYHTTVYANDAKSFRDQMELNNDIISVTAARVASATAPGAVANNITRRGVMSRYVEG